MLFGSRKSYRITSHGIAKHGTSMSRIGARADQLLNDAVGMCRRPYVPRRTSCLCTCTPRCGISIGVLLWHTPCVCTRVRPCGISWVLRRMACLCTCLRRCSFGRLLRPDGHSSLRRWRHTLRHPLSGLARQRPGSQKHFASISRLRRGCIRRRRQARTIRGACATAGSVCAPRCWLGVCVANKISARWSRSIDTRHMLILSDLPPADRITRKISAVWKKSRKEFHHTFPYTPWGTYTTQPDM
ncbi:hypothetical protein CFBP3846_02396 [Pseudomonas syringae pv. avii]|uniref:Uncharacterized protein n=2 Tax=Pseudomonas syringae group TaxID=136849 RepID=A0ABY1U5X8_PSESX|nr:hypothetical protein CFBP1573P_02553 [Pseudomonas syringae pv. persicae]SOQ09584.1 hypothetical protein NCPPB2254_02398 [Pseudomonas syringae pv. persicae]SOS26815.1 hypothetical protein CFBP3846_02396 [Pseudomonas syringae pv. avii]